MYGRHSPKDEALVSSSTEKWTFLLQLNVIVEVYKKLTESWASAIVVGCPRGGVQVILAYMSLSEA